MTVAEILNDLESGDRTEFHLQKHIKDSEPVTATETMWGEGMYGIVRTAYDEMIARPYVISGLRSAGSSVGDIVHIPRIGEMK